MQLYCLLQLQAHSSQVRLSWWTTLPGLYSRVPVHTLNTSVDTHACNTCEFLCRVDAAMLRKVQRH